MNLKSHQIHVTINVKTDFILLSENDSILVDENEAYLIPLDYQKYHCVRNTFRTAFDRSLPIRKIQIDDLDEFIETYKMWHVIEEPERRNRYSQETAY